MGSLYDYNARFYSPALGRFISADTLVPDGKNPQAFNRYAYTYNNPARYTDPTGHCIFGLDTIVCAIAVAVGTYLAKTAVETVVDTAIDYGVSQVTGEQFDLGNSLGTNLVVNGLTNGIGGTAKRVAKGAELLGTVAKNADRAATVTNAIAKNGDSALTAITKKVSDAAAAIKKLPGIFEARTVDGARVYFRYGSDNVPEILAKSNKTNQERVINLLKELYGK